MKIVLITFALNRISWNARIFIAVNIVEIATESAQNENAALVKEIDIEVGQLSGVVIDALDFCMEAAVKDTLMEGAKWNLIDIPGRGRCRSCSHEFEIRDLLTVCPECQAPSPEVYQGKELRVKSILVE